jgi:cytochrome c5
MMTHKMSLLGLGLGGVLVLSGCQSSPTVAFPTAETVATAGSRHKEDIATLERGRKIYTTSCTECHVARPIAQHSVEQWRQIVDIMAPRAGLEVADRVALEKYVLAARESL